jgi:hypothetical protein
MKRIIIAVALAASTLALAACGSLEETTANNEPQPIESTTKDKPSKAKAKAKAEAKAEPAPTAEPEQPMETTGQANARASSESYLDNMAFSRSGLIKQLKFEGFSKADATYAVDAVDPNWNKQAAKSAKTYMDNQSFSASGLQDQLEFEGFTAAQVAYGVTAAGY